MYGLMRFATGNVYIVKVLPKRILNSGKYIQIIDCVRIPRKDLAAKLESEIDIGSKKTIMLFKSSKLDEVRERAALEAL